MYVSIMFQREYIAYGMYSVLQIQVNDKEHRSLYFPETHIMCDWYILLLDLIYVIIEKEPKKLSLFYNKNYGRLK